MACPDDAQLLAYADGTLVAGERAAVEAHLDGCETCRKTVATFVKAYGPVPEQEGVAATQPMRGPEKLPKAIGPFEVISLLGVGGMGHVYRAHDPRLDREVAIKCIVPGVPLDSGWRQRFELEARAVARLQHPNIIALYDLGEFEDTPYVVTELLEGQTLRSRLARRIEPAEAVRIAVEVAVGLAAAHEGGIVHRDLKPENLFLTRDGRVKILDFGLAFDLEGDFTRPTAPGVVIGTEGYMSPEQLLGQRAGPAADIYSFGVVLLEMLTGRRGDAATALIAGLDRDLARVIRRCLEKDPRARYQSARDLAHDLEEVARPRAAPLLIPPARRWLALVAAGLAALAGAGVVAVARRPPAPRPPASWQRLSYGPASVVAGRLLSDEKSFVFATWLGHPSGGVFLGRIGNSAAQPLLPGAMLVAASRRGDLAILRNLTWNDERLGFDGTLARLEVTGGAPRDIAEHASWADFTPDGRELAVVRHRDGGQVLELGGRELTRSAAGIGPLRVAPDGARVAYIEFAVSGDSRGWVAVVDRDGRTRRLGPEQPGIDGLAWAPDGGAVLYGVLAGNVGEVRAVDLDGRERVVVRAPDELYVLDAAADGRLLVKRQSGRTHVFAHAPGADGDGDVSLFDMDFPHDLSADGKWLAFDEAGAIAGDEYRIFLRPTDGKPALDLGEGRAPKLSPDGAWVVASSISDRRRLTLLPTGVGAPRELPAGAVTVRWSPSFTPDGEQVIFAGEEGDGVTRLYLQSVAGGAPRRVGPERVDLPASMPRPISPDGKLVVAVDGERRLQLVPLDGGAARPLPGLAVDDDPLAWTPDGAELYVAPHRQPVDVVLLSVASGARRPFRRLGPDVSHGQSTFRPLVSSDGKAWAYAVLRESSSLFLVRP